MVASLISVVLDNPIYFNFFYIATTNCDSEPAAKRHTSLKKDDIDLPNIALSQPAAVTITPPNLKSLLQNSTELKPICFSQPTHNDDLILGSQALLTQSCITSVSINLPLINFCLAVYLVFICS